MATTENVKIKLIAKETGDGSSMLELAYMGGSSKALKTSGGTVLLYMHLKDGITFEQAAALSGQMNGLIKHLSVVSFP